MPGLCGLWMTCPDLVLTKLWFQMGVFVMHGFHTVWLSCTMSFGLMLMPLFYIPWYVCVSQTFPSSLWEDQLLLTDASLALPMGHDWGLSCFHWCCLWKNCLPIALMPFWSALARTPLRLWWCCVCALYSAICQSSSSLQYRNILCGHCFWIWLLCHACMAHPPSCWTAIAAPAIKIEVFWVSLPLLYFLVGLKDLTVHITVVYFNVSVYLRQQALVGLLNNITVGLRGSTINIGCICSKATCMSLLV